MSPEVPGTDYFGSPISDPLQAQKFPLLVLATLPDHPHMVVPPGLRRGNYGPQEVQRLWSMISQSSQLSCGHFSIELGAKYLITSPNSDHVQD